MIKPAGTTAARAGTMAMSIAATMSRSLVPALVAPEGDMQVGGGVPPTIVMTGLQNGPPEILRP
jgi:hypothetical protein